MGNLEHDVRDHAGPFGFTRREVVVIVAILATSVAVLAYAEWRASRRQSLAWIMEDVPIESTQASPHVDSSSMINHENAPATPLRISSDLIDVNSADERALVRLPGIGAGLARRIVEERLNNGSFVNLTDLQRVKGIGPRKAAMLSGWVKFSSKTEPVEDTLEIP